MQCVPDVKQNNNKAILYTE